MVVTSNCALSVLVISFTYVNTEIYYRKASFADIFTDWKDLYKKIFLEMKVEEDLKFLLAQITLKYSKNRRETAAAPRVFAR